ncbi:phosphoglycerate kinase [Alphaproteobacteria bacterium]|nr:phosphoglycerate kinase [Alphaproteobacteria bacterium]
MKKNSFHNINDIDVTNKNVLVRADLNVPMQNGKITDTHRIKNILPTINNLLKRKAKIMIISHYGRPKGKKLNSLSLKNISSYLEDSLDISNLLFVEDCIGNAVKGASNQLEPGSIALLENLRFHIGEEKNDINFSKELAKFHDIYVNEAFSCSHRAHASIEGVTHFLPSVAGIELSKEISTLNDTLLNPERPIAAIVGGSKISTKLKTLRNLITKVDKIFVGGGMANTFFDAQGIQIGKSIKEKNMINEAKEIYSFAIEKKCKLILPFDVVIANKLEKNAFTQTVNINSIPTNKMILDVGDRSIKKFFLELKDCKSLLWNGPLGAFEIEPFDKSTISLAKFIAKETKSGNLLSVAGGGDTLAALSKSGVKEKFSYLSTAGGAFLEWLEGLSLPGIKALELKTVKNKYLL